MPGFEKTPTNENIPIEQFPRLSAPLGREYVDAHTGVRLTVEYDIPEHPKITAFWSEDGSTSLEEINEAVARLMTSAGLLRDEKDASMEVYDPTSGQTIEAKRGLDGLPIVEQ